MRRLANLVNEFLTADALIAQLFMPRQYVYGMGASGTAGGPVDAGDSGAAAAGQDAGAGAPHPTSMHVL